MVNQSIYSPFPRKGIICDYALSSKIRISPPSLLVYWGHMTTWGRPHEGVSHLSKERCLPPPDLKWVCFCQESWEERWFIHHVFQPGRRRTYLAVQGLEYVRSTLDKIISAAASYSMIITLFDRVSLIRPWIWPELASVALMMAVMNRRSYYQ
jgi:hypothetical protein